MKNVIFIAPPAAGKGTISDYLVSNYGYIHLSTGDLLREEVKTGSSLGQEIDALISKGKLVSNEVIISLMKDKLINLARDVKPFILDGFPRTLEQAQVLDQIFKDYNIDNNLVIYLNLDKDLAVKRALGRLTCPKCKRTYNLASEDFKPLKDNICDNCNIPLEKRTDDNEEAFKERFDTYLINTKPIIDFYKDKDLLKEIDVSKDIKEVLIDIEDVLNSQVVRYIKEAK